MSEDTDRDAGASGETNTGSSLGAGEGAVFKQKNGVDLEHRSLKQGTNITITQDATEITINATAAASTLTTKGDVQGFDTAENRIPVGANDQVLTADSTQALGLKWAAAVSGAIGGDPWVEIGTYDGETVDFVEVDVTAYQAVKIVYFDITTSSSAIRTLFASTDGGATFRSTVGDYVEITNTGVKSNGGSWGFHDTATTSARSGWMTLDAINGNGNHKHCESNGTDRLFVLNTLPITDLRFGASAGNMNGGSAKIYALPKTNIIGAFSGALVAKTGSQSITGGNTDPLTFNTETYDVGGWHDNSTNNSRLTVPSGVTRVRITGGVRDVGSVSGQFILRLTKNGGTAPGMPHQESDTSDGDACSIASPVLDVVATDYFELDCFVTTTRTIDNDDSTYFSIEAV